MNKKIIVCLLFILMPIIGHTQVVINEIMYNSPGADIDWVEIYNSGQESIDLTGWKLSENSISHNSLVLVQGNEPLAAGDYAIIVTTSGISTFLSDNPSFTRIVLRGSFNLPNSNKNTLTLKNASGDVQGDPVDYDVSTQGASGDGNSLQHQADGSWLAALPTPGSSNATIVYVPPTEASTTDQTVSTTTSTTETTSTQTSGNGTISTHSSQADLTNTEAKTPGVGAGRERYTTIDTPVAFEAWVKDASISTGGYFWSFGDGSTASGARVSHSYQFPGLYNVVLNANFNGKEAVSRTTVKVTNSEIKIKQIDQLAGYIELENNSTIETNLFGWNLTCDNNSFIFPRDTIIVAKNNLKIPIALTKCSINTAVWSLSSGKGKVLAQSKIPATLENIAEREQMIVSIKQKIDFITAELAKIKGQPPFANKLKTSITQVKTDLLSTNNQIAVATSAEKDLGADSQSAGVIVLDKDPLPANKSFFSRLKSWFWR
jgi:hypothetical protein